ncbi:riboflavin biosynthesis protein RibD [Sphingobacterium spiritivorum ATCC 33300]|uniref:Riboflavin biosynthesis protein RibD n=1 Tax=Sphingobacterium spiritivorum ATCC 33300 TaxID=525372 RepID=C2FW87_SPHSI|nr:bifunctional diaminohydroxyphosphoribosylaminopyrimidine deaminase/5-amino-6-(5-phosphoribosylamino)uracil reductase RibD [Sphingobacterium spiritivorum]EEI92867.1 riboflavin biosynthesis protein RibD [Sphingobacterium spiritivorum ATCC 33300]QQS96412.1 bifunctional diaminohydroxyphosphoribosylaminopyrimidine deaminase/5-amino-6-(5-phosphoribosylamino)uracil reductase RibD [Sphingobacterium spiritivorum]
MNMQERYMQRCLELALLGAGTVSPNPMVGAVIVHENKIIGEGYTSPYGGPHAEVNAIQQVKDQYPDSADRLLAESDMYVSLEPCAHFGKTPPCANLIVKHNLRKVYIACMDPFAQVNGKGLGILQQAGIEVEVGLLEKEALWLNRRFFTRVRQNRPYVILKWAETADGYMAKNTDEQAWISNEASKQLVHRWRSEEDAILVGTRTALIDNPSLTVREWEGNNPKRVLIDKQLSVPESAAIFSEDADTIVFNAVKTDWQGRIKYIELENYDLYLPQNILYQLYLMDIQSIIIEGGAKTLQLFIDAGLWDEARVIRSKVLWEGGIKAPVVEGELKEQQAVASDDFYLIVKKN